MLAYHIMGSANPEHAARLLKWIYSGKNYYLVTFDNFSSLKTFKQVAKVADNVDAISTPPVTWGGISMVASILTAMRHLMRIDQKWKYFILLSDSDVPLKSQADICSILDNESRLGKRCFMHFNEQHYRELDNDLLDYSLPYSYQQRLPVRTDVKFLVHEQLHQHFDELTESPIYIAKKRLQFHVTESRHDKILYIRPLEQFELEFRNSVFCQYAARFGKVWCILNRRTCNWLLQWEELSLLFTAFSSTFCPDESLLHTALGGPHFSWFAELETSNRFRWRGGTADVISDEKLSSLRASGCFFARKVRLDRAECLFDWIESWCG